MILGLFEVVDKFLHTHLRQHHHFISLVKFTQIGKAFVIS